MLGIRLVSLLAFTGSALAELDFSKWKTRQPGELRAPCPAMNSLANHGFIQRDGKNITVEGLTPVLKEVFHLSHELAFTVSQLGLFTALDPSKGVFTLQDLTDRHNVFEHDASLSREDAKFGGDQSVLHKGQFQKFMDHFKGEKYISFEAAAKARYAMVQDSRKRNPDFTYDVTHRITSYGETIKYLRTIVEPSTGKCPVDWIKILFEQERLPYKEGWRPPTNELSGFSLASEVLELALITPEKLPVDECLGKGKGKGNCRRRRSYLGI
ncbi:Putative aromatic peroxygenase involved in aflatoxin biosynthesis orthologous to A. nidulans stcC, member of the aflatoxin cluster [Podospora comata]|uniref:Aromatic peroxygenase involved in aflatoxin biosynthesis orthologous to A. nidulans stcC, member of the aflatoxin cluster n=1 Tax=Podospora comata TaxID=48703 RepID=A0ABY6S3Y3_PODCO|nr:Putative aromatic peroxygenase involved in aflatoxin biosynthesis orthologous to A. nidulans stcC, member of the aflatoxin cluster [Podospora comata]